MKIIKLDTINSTNSYLREMAIHQDIDNFTVVTANHQSEGKGQIDKKWITEPNKNLTFSILLKEKYQIPNKKYINIVVRYEDGTIYEQRNWRITRLDKNYLWYHSDDGAQYQFSRHTLEIDDINF